MLGDLLLFYTALLSLSEIGLGSLLHTMQVPFRGQFLSLNQSFLLSHALFQSKGEMKLLPLKISSGAALLKSLSPSGRRLTPMIAIAIQGSLFNLGSLLFGRNLIGAIFGSILLGIWPSIQGFAFYGVLFGKDVLLAAEALPHAWALPAVFGLFVGIKSILAICAVLAAYFLPSSVFLRYQDLICGVEQRPKKESSPSSFLRVFRSPLFLALLFLVSWYYWVVLGDLYSLSWFLLRLAASTFLSIYVVRLALQSFWVRKKMQFLWRRCFGQEIDEDLLKNGQAFELLQDYIKENRVVQD